MMPQFWQGKRVFITGHTGFKGAWLCLWLQALGAKVYGYALDAPTTPNLFDVAGVAPYWVAVHRAEMRSLSSTITALFDRVLVPISRCTYQFLPGLDSGKNLVLIATAEHPMA